MTGSPIDGIPWWGKAIYYTILAPLYVVEVVKEKANKVFAKKEKKGKK